LQSRFRASWDMTLLLAVTYITVVLPLQVGLEVRVRVGSSHRLRVRCRCDSDLVMISVWLRCCEETYAFGEKGMVLVPRTATLDTQKER